MRPPKMIVETEQYFVLLGTLDVAPATATGDQIRAYSWIPYGPYADQTECVKILMMGTYHYDELKIIRCKLPLLKKPDHATVSFDELIEEAVVEELVDEPGSK